MKAPRLSTVLAAARVGSLLAALVGLAPPALAQWNTPDPLYQPRPGARMEDFVRLAVLPPGPELDGWMDAVKRRMDGADCREMAPARRALCGIAAALGEYGVIYRPTAGVELDRARDMAANVPPPLELLRSRGGECRQTSLLAAATLRLLGLRPVLVLTGTHVVPAVLSDEPAGGTDVDGVLLDSDGAPDSTALRIVPVETVFPLSWSREPAAALERGREFVAGIREVDGSLVSDMEGRILWRGKVHSVFPLGAPMATSGNGRQ